MIHFKPTDKSHSVTCTNQIGDFFEGQKTIVRMMRMSGKIFKPGKGKDGKWLDQEGKLDERIMVFDDSHYCIGTKELKHYPRWP